VAWCRPNQKARYSRNGSRQTPSLLGLGCCLPWRTSIYGRRHKTVYMTNNKQEVMEVLRGPQRQRRWSMDEKLAWCGRASRQEKPRITRYLSPERWLEVKTWIQAVPKETDREREHYSRTCWLFALLYLGGLRIIEVGENTMGRFFRRRVVNGEDLWWLDVLGKGDKGAAGASHLGDDGGPLDILSRTGTTGTSISGRRHAPVTADRAVAQTVDARRTAPHRQAGFRRHSRRTACPWRNACATSRSTEAGVCALAEAQRRVAYRGPTGRLAARA